VAANGCHGTIIGRENASSVDFNATDAVSIDRDSDLGIVVY